MEFVLITMGAALVAAAVAANQAWLDRHFLPSFFIPRHWYVLIETAARCLVGAAGVLMIVGRRWLARMVMSAPVMIAQVIVAAVLAIGASEAALRWIHLRPTEWLVADEEPRRQPDARLGWVLAPERVGRSRIGGRTIDYAIDRSGSRVRSVDEPVNPALDTIVFAGESVMFGEGLTWQESIPARAGAMLHVQTANIAVHGYSTDQMYMRLERELPRFERPVAVVTIFMTELFGRNLDDDRPHLAPGFAWQPAEHASRLMSLAGLLVPYRRTSTVDAGVQLSQDVLRAIGRLAQTRHAVPLVIVPTFGPEDDAQRSLRARILTVDIPHVVIALDPHWRLPWDRHPNARAAEAIASAIAARLRPS